MSTPSNSYQGFRYPAEIINQAVWLYHCFSLSLREVELILATRGIVVSYEAIRAWSLRFGPTYAKTLRRRRPQAGDKWFLDEVFVRIRGKLHYLWRAVDQHGNVLDVLVQSRRNLKAAKRFFRKLLILLCHKLCVAAGTSWESSHESADEFNSDGGDRLGDVAFGADRRSHEAGRLSKGGTLYRS
jgi:putative transposase